MIKDLIKIFKYHGLLNGFLRSKDQIMQNYLFDFVNKVETSSIIKNYSNLQSNKDKWYQPCYNKPVKEAFEYLKDNEDLNKFQISFVDIGCGKGKPSIIFSKVLKNFKNFGIDIDNKFNAIFYKNTKKFNNENYFINQNILAFNLEKAKSDVMIFFFMNTLNSESLLKLLENIRKVSAKKKFFVYHNPENSKILNDLNLIYSKKEGWHKLWGVNIYSI